MFGAFRSLFWLQKRRNTKKWGVTQDFSMYNTKSISGSPKGVKQTISSCCAFINNVCHVEQEASASIPSCWNQKLLRCHSRAVIFSTLSDLWLDKQNLQTSPAGSKQRLETGVSQFFSPYDSRTPMTSCESKASPSLSAWTSFMALSCSLFLMLEKMDSFHVSSMSCSEHREKGVKHKHAHWRMFLWITVKRQKQTNPLTLRTMLSSMLDFLLLPCLPIKVISSWQKGLGRMSHCVKNFLHSTMYAFSNAVSSWWLSTR